MPIVKRSSAIVLFLVLVSPSLACLLSSNGAASPAESVRTYNTFLHMIIGYQVAALFFLTLMMCFARFKPDHDENADLQPWHQFIRRNVSLFGIGIFYVAVFAYSVFSLVAHFKCVDAWNACADADVHAGHVTEMVYTCVRLVYLSVVLLFCIKFNAAHIARNSLVLAGLVVVEAANVSDWMKSIVDESEDTFSSKPNGIYEISVCFNATDGVNATDRFVQCFRRTNAEYNLLHSLTPYLYWLIMEYLMLAIEAVAEWFLSNAETGVDLQLSHMHEPPEATPLNPTRNHVNASPATKRTSIMSYGSTNATDDDDDASDSQASTEHTEDAAASTSADPVAEYTRRRTGQATANWWVFFGIVAASLIINFLMVIVRVYDFVIGEENPDWTGYQYVFVSYRTVYWLALLGTALVGYAVARRSPGRRHSTTNLTIFERFVMFCCIGPITQSMFTIISADQNTDSLLEDPLKNCIIVKEAVNVLQVCVQVMLYVQVKNVRIRTDGDVEERRSLRVLDCMMSCVVVCNFALWAELSVQTRESTDSWEKHFFRNWPFIYSIFNPFTLVFRFNSALLFLNAVLYKRRSMPDHSP